MCTCVTICRKDMYKSLNVQQERYLFVVSVAEKVEKVSVWIIL